MVYHVKNVTRYEPNTQECLMNPQNSEVKKTNKIDYQKGTCTVCPRSSVPFYIGLLLYKMGHYFLDIEYASIYNYCLHFREHNLTPLARIVAYSDAALDPVDWPVAPATGIQELLKRAGYYSLL